jgi:hypothetical protein
MERVRLRTELLRWGTAGGRRGRGRLGARAGGGGTGGGGGGGLPSRGGRTGPRRSVGLPFALNIHRKMAIRDFIPARSTLLAEAVGAVGIPGGGWGRDFQRLWEGPGAGGRWPGAFHIRSASTAWVGEGFACQSGPSRPAGKPACGSAGLCAELRAALREPRAGLRAALGGRDCAAPPPSAPFGSALSRMGIFWERNGTGPAPALDGIPGAGWYLYGIY